MAKYEFDVNFPIYLQIMDEIKKDIFSEKIAIGDKISSVRDLALEFGVNPNTIQKALTELEREGLLTSVRAVGRFVSDNKEAITQAKKTLCNQNVKKYVEMMRALGCTKQEIIEFVQSYLEAEII